MKSWLDRVRSRQAKGYAVFRKWEDIETKEADAIYDVYLLTSMSTSLLTTARKNEVYCEAVLTVSRMAARRITLSGGGQTGL